MKKMASLFLLISSLLLINQAHAETVTFSTTAARTTLLELYTSEGCSSCPPADRWLSRLKQDPRLWKELFPVAFHVDYWNYLGWNDVFSNKAFSSRQRTYASFGYAYTVYTPGFFRNGREWRGWFRKPILPKNRTINIGSLSATVNAKHIIVTFNPAVTLNSTYLNIAILGMNRMTHVRAGENNNQQLQHDFVALSHTLYKDISNHWQIPTENFRPQLNEADAIVLWVTEENDPTPIQTTGGWLPNK